MKGAIGRASLGVPSLLVLTACSHLGGVGFYSSDCEARGFPMHPTKSRVAWTATSGGGQRIVGRVREVGRKGAAVPKAWVLMPGPGEGDTLRIPVDSSGAFARDSLPLGRHRVIVRSRGYWDAIGSVDVRADSVVHADARLEPLPPGWHSCIPH